MLSREQLDLIPDALLNARTTEGLLEWLQARGWSMTLLELDTERRLRKTLSAVGARQMAPARKHSGRRPQGTPPPTPGARDIPAVAAPNACAEESRFFDACAQRPES